MCWLGREIEQMSTLPYPYNTLIAYWQMYLHTTIFTDKSAYKTQFREVLGYDASTGTYAKDILPLERSDMTIAEWVENNFSGI